MIFDRRRAAVIVTAAVVTGLSVLAAPARAASCTSVPGSVSGTDVTILDQDHPGAPDAPDASCAVAIGSDDLPGTPPPSDPGVLLDNPLCETYYEDPPGSGNWVSFCDDPVGGVRSIVGNVQQYCGEGNCTPRAIRCLVLAVLGQECI